MVTFGIAKNRVAAMAVMRSLVVGVVMAGCLAGPVCAQEQKEKEPLILEQEQKKRDAEAIDKQYKSTLEKTHKDTTQTRTDPWSNMRGADDAKTKR